MIKLERPNGSIPDGLLAAGLRERRENRKALAAGVELNFEAYRAKSVRQRLAEIFGRKCVFCESSLLGTQPGDIEHYRPKGKIANDVELPFKPKPAKRSKRGAANNAPVHDGYWWLAAEWSNLLISCADCNRPREQEDYDNHRRVIGKSNFFPIAAHSARAQRAGALQGEVPLLLNPCLDDPDDHLVFRDDGAVEPVKVNGEVCKKGEASIHYLGLVRAELLQARARHGRNVMSCIRHIKRALVDCADPGEDLTDLISMLNSGEPYVAFTRTLIKLHLEPHLKTLGL